VIDEGPELHRVGPLAGRLDGSGRDHEPAVDDVDRAIIGELWRDGRLSVRALAERVHVSRTNAYARLDRLIADGVITGFGAKVDPKRVGLRTSAFVTLSIEQNSWRSVAGELTHIPYVEEVALVGGEFDILALVRTPDNTVLREVVLDRIQDIPHVRSTRTWLIFDEADGAGSYPAPGSVHRAQD
jgi:DNA-binding Lrp family transcriptional regulator